MSDRFDWSGNQTVSETTGFSYCSDGWTFWLVLMFQILQIRYRNFQYIGNEMIWSTFYAPPCTSTYWVFPAAMAVLLSLFTWSYACNTQYSKSKEVLVSDDVSTDQVISKHVFTAVDIRLIINRQSVNITPLNQSITHCMLYTRITNVITILNSSSSSRVPVKSWLSTFSTTPAWRRRWQRWLHLHTSSSISKQLQRNSQVQLRTHVQ